MSNSDSLVEAMKMVMRDRDAVVKAVALTASDLKRQIRLDPNKSIERDEDYIDIRLCVDDDRWTIRSGDVAYDAYHSRHCSASIVTLETDPVELADYLMAELE